MDFIPEGSMWLLYLGLFFGPFVQEDAAVIGAASLSLSESNHWISIFGFILAGLIASDSWKYWLGWAAKHHKWAKKYGELESVQKMRDGVLTHSIKTLLAVRFIPLARVPTYLATGFFGVSYLKYWLCIAISATAYVTIIFTGFHLLGEIMGEHLKTYAPFAALVFAIIFITFIVIAYRKKHIMD
ncbi:MAG: hypothetical protein EX271_10340 [Acidimicrobiales bacterium]|nr:hypothetical protein [Hyphomonadaceae bacterium]RZV39984.1 MAG: hypothetical protein EX271_10340 [Acidimicrobiales bacterium]